MIPNLSIQILIQPQQRGYRFRYRCEGEAHGPIFGEGGSKQYQVFPTVEIYNCPSHANVYLHVSLCAEDSSQVHMHNLYGKNVFNGEYFEQLQASVNGYLKHSLQGICIIQTKNAIKNEILGCKIAQRSILNEQGILDYVQLMKDWAQKNVVFDTSCFKLKIPNLDSYITSAGDIFIANNAVRFHYQAFVFKDERQFVHLQVCSQPVFDNKTPSRAILKIHKISRVSGSSDGGEEIILLCDKIEKGDIEVVFYTEDAEGRKLLIGNGQFSPIDVWHQYAIVFKTPPCHNYEHVEACICLRRKKNPNDMSNSFPFTYISQFPIPPYFPQEPLMDTSMVNASSPYRDISQTEPSYLETHGLSESYSLNNRPDYSFNSTVTHYPQPPFDHIVEPPQNIASFNLHTSQHSQHPPSLFQLHSSQNLYPNNRGSDLRELS